MSLEDGPDIENIEMDGKTVWEQEAKDGADLIVDDYARHGDYDDGRGDLSQKNKVGEDTRLSYDLKG